MTIERDNEHVQVKALWDGSAKKLTITENGLPVESHEGLTGLIVFIALLTTFNTAI